jgi:chromosome segregation ATPase
MTILNDKLFHLQEQNHELKKALQVDLKAQVSNQTLKNEALEEEIKRLKEKLREKDHQLNSLLGRPGGPDKMDDISRREEAIHSRQIRIDELEDDIKLMEEKNDEISEALEQEREKVLELRFEKESHDL